MKKIVNVNIGGFAFVIEEQAYERLNIYLDKVRLNLGATPEANEVMNDIEMRIAELFKEQLSSSGKEVIEDSMIDEVVKVMGRPEDFGDGEQKEQASSKEQFVFEDRKVLFRDPEDKLLGGVASGLAHYMGWNVLLVRILFVLLGLGFFAGIVIYVLLWILVPEARSTADRLRMRGEPINIDTLKSRFNDFTKDLGNLGSKENERKIKNAASNFGSKVENAFSDFGKVLAKIIGALILAFGIFLLVMFIRGVLTTTISIPENPMEEFFFQHHDLFFENRFDYYALIIGGIIIAVLILYGLISAGFELLFNVKLRNKPLKYITSTISILAVIAIFYGGVNLGKNFSHDESVTKKYELILPDSTLELQVSNDNFFNNKLVLDDTDDEELLKVVNTKLVFGYPTLEIKLSEDGSNYMEVSRIATGPRNIKAIENCENIEYESTVDTGKVILSPTFATSVKNKFRSQEVIVTLYLADNVKIHNTGNLKRILDSYSSYLYYEELKDAEWYQMDKKGLLPVK